MRILLTTLVCVALLIPGCTQSTDNGSRIQGTPQADGRGDVTVVAIIDSGFNPYHWDFLAAHMPQALNDDPSDDLPLDQDPTTWLPGYPGVDSFASYNRLDLKLTPEDKTAVPQTLYNEDKAAWDLVKQSSPTGDIHMTWIPGTKVIGYVNFGSGTGFAASSHGVGTTSVSVGNIHGSCPNCVLLFVNGLSDEAVTWVSQQDWIDVQSNSWGYSKAGYDKIWTDCDLDTQRAGVERGQQIFFSGGNGMVNAFDAPPSTLYSCQKGADWVVTVGANTPAGASYTGHGKPADISNVGSSYPSAGGGTVTADATFSGTSNAAPVTTGLFAAALEGLRRQFPGNSRLQADGVIASGPAECGSENPACAMADGQLTVHELRRALYDASTLLDSGNAAVTAAATVPASTEELRYLSQGHGSFFGRVGDLEAEVASIQAQVLGTAAAKDLDAYHMWNIAVSYCSQQVWGKWEFGEWNGKTPMPAPSPQWPYRTWLVTECPRMIGAIITAADIVA